MQILDLTLHLFQDAYIAYYWTPDKKEVFVSCYISYIQYPVNVDLVGFKLKQMSLSTI